MKQQTLALAAIAIVSACVSDSRPNPVGPDPVPPGPAPLQTVVYLGPDSIALGNKGEIQFVSARLLNSDGTDGQDPTPITWTSNNTKVASIPKGTIGFWVPVTAVANGSAWIVGATATSRDSVLVRVNIDEPTDKPLWRFTVAAGVRTDLSAEQVRSDVQTALNGVNQRFNIPGAFAGKFEFVLDSVFTYPVSSSVHANEMVVRPRSANYLVLFDPVAEFVSGGGAFLGYGTVQITLPNWTIDPQTAQVLTHELGHARNAVDIYHYNRISNFNNEPSFIMPASIMEAEGGSWDEMSRVIIGHNAGKYPVPDLVGWKEQDFPLKQGVRVTRRNGVPVAGARVLLKIPGPLHVASMAVVADGTTDTNGQFIPDFNVFNPRTNVVDPKAWCSNPACLYHVLLVEVHADNIVTYGWMSTMDAVISAARNPGEPYIKRIRVGDPPA